MKPIKLSHEDLDKMGIKTIECLQNLNPAVITIDSTGIEITLVNKEGANNA